MDYSILLYTDTELFSNCLWFGLWLCCCDGDEDVGTMVFRAMMAESVEERPPELHGGDLNCDTRRFLDECQGYQSERMVENGMNSKPRGVSIIKSRRGTNPSPGLKRLNSPRKNYLLRFLTRIRSISRSNARHPSPIPYYSPVPWMPLLHRWLRGN